MSLAAPAGNHWLAGLVATSAVWQPGNTVSPVCTLAGAVTRCPGCVLGLFLAGQAVMAAASPESLASRYVIEPPSVAILPVLGMAVLLGGAVLLVVAQLELGASWRIGIEQGARPGLVTSGVYRFCRNPIFFAILSVLTGYTLLLPTRLSLVLLVSAFVGMRLQVLTEEAYLSKAYGATYREYARGVGRFLPGIGRLR